MDEMNKGAFVIVMLCVHTTNDDDHTSVVCRVNVKLLFVVLFVCGAHNIDS